MRLKSFRIRSYRSCINTNLFLNDNLTSLIGINSAGKSNILNAILLLRKIWRSRFRQVRGRESSYNKCDINAIIEHGSKTIHLRGKITFETDEHNFDEVQSVKLKWNIKDFSGISEWIEVPVERIISHDDYHFLDPSRFVPTRNRYMHMSRKEFDSMHKQYKIFQEKIRPPLHNAIDFLSGINYYSASRFSDPSRCPVSIEFEENRPLRRSYYFAGHEKFILDLYNSYNLKDAQYKRYLNTVNKSGIGLIDDIVFKNFKMPSSSIEVMSGGKTKKVERVRSLIVPIFKVEGSSLSPNQLSEGTFKTLAMLFYVLTDESKLLLLEEPEVCIHHGLLDSIIALIKSQSRQKQIIISTHSDYVLDHLGPDNIILVKKEPNKGTVAKPLNAALSKNDFKALRSYLEESGSLGEYWKESGFVNG